MAEIGNSNGFSAQKQVTSKKKRSSLKLRRIFRPQSEIPVFSAQIQVISKQKKKVFTDIETDFSAEIGNSQGSSERITATTLQLRHPNPFGGGAVFILSSKIGLKSTKNVRFCILYRPMGGSSTPRLPLATLLDGDLPKTAPPKFKLFYL